MRKRVVLIFTVDILLILIAIAIYNPFLKLNLNGEEEIEITFGNYYQDEGITASYFDDDLSNQVTIQNDINLMFNQKSLLFSIVGIWLGPYLWPG